MLQAAFKAFHCMHSLTTGYQKREHKGVTTERHGYSVAVRFMLPGSATNSARQY